ncbi:alpha/beta hydrolase family protein [Fodinicola acaciae]|uniref:alpha/beta hydrolase family protein n=1 Tax=Fodinicola acaciae TaxID=2681555 RepID=UPI001651DA2C|nr:prolyl oligopeptidase family serine peptidase [Fodinicola acaciae]
MMTGTAAGVPYLALPPHDTGDNPSLIVGWHLSDPPRTEAAMAAALPMAQLPAWRVYFGLPLHGSRLPAGGHDEVMRLAYEDAVVNNYGAMVEQAVAEFPAALAAVRSQLGVDERPIGMFGGSSGSGVAMLSLLETDVEVSALAVVSPMVQLASIVAANEKLFGVTYDWHDTARKIAARWDLLARAAEFGPKAAAVRIIVGEKDTPAVTEPAEKLWQTLSRDVLPADRVSLVTIPGMAHALAEPPGDDAAPQTADAARVEAAMTEWFARWMK